MTEFVISEPTSIEPRKPVTPFTFEGAFFQFWRTSGGTGFALKLIVTLGLVYAALSFLSTFVMYRSFTPDPEIALELMNSPWRLTGIMIVTYAIMLSVLAMGAGAVHRKVLFDEESPGFPLRFGADELRLILVYLGFLLLMVIAYFLLAFVLVMFVGGVGIGLGSAAAGFFTLILGLGVVGLLMWIAVRLSPLGAATVALKRPVLIGAKDVSKHRSAILFAVYLVLNIILGVVFIVAYLPVFSEIDFANPGVVPELPPALTMLLTLVMSFVFIAAALWTAAVGSYAFKNYLESQTQSDVFS